MQRHNLPHSPAFSQAHRSSMACRESVEGYVTVQKAKEQKRVTSLSCVTMTPWRSATPPATRKTLSIFPKGRAAFQVLLFLWVDHSNQDIYRLLASMHLHSPPFLLALSCWTLRSPDSSPWCCAIPSSLCASCSCKRADASTPAFLTNKCLSPVRSQLKWPFLCCCYWFLCYSMPISLCK